MRVTGLELTQGIQSLNDDVFLIQNRRTFVRMYVESDFPGVSWVGAQIEATWDGGSSFLPLVPINPAGTHLTVATFVPAQGESSNFSFSFATGHSTSDATIQLGATVNAPSVTWPFWPPPPVKTPVTVAVAADARSVLTPIAVNSARVRDSGFCPAMSFVMVFPLFSFAFRSADRLNRSSAKVGC